MRVRTGLIVFTVVAAVAGGAMAVYGATSIDQVGSDIDGETGGDSSGSAVALSSDGSVVAIGAYGNDDAGTAAGHVRVYQWDGTAWTQRGDDIDGEAAGDRAGFSVALSSDGTTVAVGAHMNDGNGVDSGHVRIYQWDGTAWTQLGTDIDGEADNNYSGASVSLSSDGTIVAIGAPDNSGNGDDAGHVRIYQWDGTAWTQLGTDIDGEAALDLSGSSVSLSSDGTTVAIGAYRNDDAGDNAGHVRIYQWDGTAWTQLGTDIDGEAALDVSGASVSLSSDGTTVAIGAYGNNNSTGHVRIYQWDGTAWTQLGTDIDGEAADDQAGISVSLSSDGTIVGVGAYGNNGNGYASGHVRIHGWNGTAWTQLGTDIDGEAAYDSSGVSVSLSSDGSIVAIGAAGNNAGHVRVYSIVTTLNITYDSQGGSAVSDGDATTTRGGTIDVLPSDPTRDGYTFAGWFTAASGGTEITSDAAHNQTADFTVYAQWTANPTTTVATTTTTLQTTTTTVATTTTESPTTTVIPTTTDTDVPTTTAVVLPTTGSSDGTVTHLLLALGVGGLLVLVTRRGLSPRDAE